MKDHEVICITIFLGEAADAQGSSVIYQRFHFWVVDRLTGSKLNAINYNFTFWIFSLYTQGMSQDIIHFRLPQCLPTLLMFPKHTSLAFSLVILYIIYPN